MTNTVLIKRSSVPGSVPVAGNLVAGELAINYADGKLYFLGSGGAVTQIAGNSSMTFSGNVSAGNILTGGLISAAGNITGNNVILPSGTVLNETGIFVDAPTAQAQTIQVSSNLIGTGVAITTNGITGGLLSSGNIYFKINATLNANAAPSGGTTVAQISSEGFAITGNVSTDSDVGSNNISAINAINGGSLYTSGNITANGSIIIASGGNIGGANVVFGNTVDTVSLSVTGNSNLGNIANVKISGGTVGQVITTDGSGNLSFSTAASSSNPAPMPIVVDIGETLTIANNYQGLFAYPLTIDGTLDVDGVLIEVDGGIVDSSPGQIIFDDGYAATGNANLTFNQTTATVTTNNLTLSGNAILGNLATANYFSGNGSLLTGIVAVSSYGNANVVANLAALGSNPVSTTGNITASYFSGNGSLLTGIVATSSYGNANVAANLAAFGSNPVSTTGNITSGNLSASGNVTAGYLLGSYSNVTSTLVVGFNEVNYNTVANADGIFTNTVSATGNITASYFVGNGSLLTGIGGTGMSWVIANSNVTMSTNNGYFVDTSGGAKTMTLPASAVIGDTVRINDLAGTFGTNNLTVGRNGGNIQGVAEDLLVSVNQSSFGLVYSNSTYGWKLLEF